MNYLARDNRVVQEGVEYYVACEYNEIFVRMVAKVETISISTT